MELRSGLRREVVDRDEESQETNFALLNEGESSTQDSGTGVSLDDAEGPHRSRIMEEMIGIRRYLFEKLHLTNFSRDVADGRHLPKVLETVNFEGLIKHWNENKFKKIITMVGAGISTCKYCSSFQYFSKKI